MELRFYRHFRAVGNRYVISVQTLQHKRHRRLGNNQFRLYFFRSGGRAVGQIVFVSVYVVRDMSGRSDYGKFFFHKSTEVSQRILREFPAAARAVKHDLRLVVFFAFRLAEINPLHAVVCVQ